MASAHVSNDLSVIIPLFNEAGGIAGVLADLKKHVPGAEIILVDDGSTDDSRSVAQKALSAWPESQLLAHPFNLGYGSSLKTGMRAATRHFVAWFDSDGEHQAKDLLAMLERLKDKKLAAVIGERSHSTSAFRGGGKLFIRILTELLGVPRVRDLNCGLRVFVRKIAVSYLNILPNRFSASMTTTILYLERGYPVEFHPIESAPRKGESKVRFKDGLRALYKALTLIMLFAPMRIFFGTGLGFFLAGSIYGTMIAIKRGEGFPALGIGFVIIGFLLVMLGLISGQISEMRIEGYEPRKLYDKIQ